MTIRELLLSFIASFEQSVSTSTKVLIELIDVILFEANWLDAHWFYVLVAVGLWYFLVVSIINLVKKLWHRLVAPESEVLVTDWLVVGFVGVAFLLAAFLGY